MGGGEQHFGVKTGEVTGLTPSLECLEQRRSDRRPGGVTCWPSGQRPHASWRPGQSTIPPSRRHRRREQGLPRYGNPLMWAASPTRRCSRTLPGLGVSPVHLTGFDTEMLFSAAIPAPRPSTHLCARACSIRRPREDSSHGQQPVLSLHPDARGFDQQPPELHRAVGQL